MARRSVFISYAREDAAEVQAAAALLTAGGVQVFLDVRDIAYGERWDQVLDQALRRCERVMVFWSLAAQASQWVEREWRTALALGKRIVPTLLDATPLPSELAAFQALPRFRHVVVQAPADFPSSASRSAPARTRGPGASWMLPVILLVGLAVAASAWLGLEVPHQGQPVPPDPRPPEGSGPWLWLLPLAAVAVAAGAWRARRRRTPAAAAQDEARRFVAAVFAD